MNQISTNGMATDHVLLRKAEIFTVLSHLCRDLELTETQLKSAQVSYEAVGLYLSSSEHPYLKSLRMYVHGSTALGTTVKPITSEEHDVDLIAHAPDYPVDHGASALKKLIGDHLKENGRYAPILEEKKRCWRINYAREFHLDITPAITNPSCSNGGELVPDKQARDWKPSNPKGYKALFERRVALRPQMLLQKMVAADSAEFASVEDFPHHGNKGILQLIVQLAKRHRDIYFKDVTEDIAPISIIITTLAARAYEFCVERFSFDTEIDVLIATLRMMPHFIERPVIDGRKFYVVPNETTAGENFAERWNSEPARAMAFYTWQAEALQDFENIAAAEGIDTITKLLEQALGTGPTRKVLDARTRVISQARKAQTLFVAPIVGLTVSSSASATQVRPNTYFGD